MRTSVPDLGVQVHHLARCLRLIKQAWAAERSIVPLGAADMLMRIAQSPRGCHGRELAAGTSLDQSTVSRVVRSLVAHEFVERRADPDDGRATVLVLTTAGRTALAASHAWYEQLLTRALADWTEAELTALRDTLDRFSHDIEHALGHHEHLEAAR